MTSAAWKPSLTGAVGVLRVHAFEEIGDMQFSSVTQNRVLKPEQFPVALRYLGGII